MNIYFSCSITGGRNDQAAYQAIVVALESQGHQVPTAHLSRTDVMAAEAVISADEVFQRDVNWVKECDALIAEVSTPSHGVGYEIALAVQYQKPVLCCYQKGKKVSKMILGNDSQGLTLCSYDTISELVLGVDTFIKGLS
jgi:2'-deoxynucleoside 5'-phosphate N-hydrolase